MPIRSPTYTVPNYQTVRLGRGKHRSPEEGVCAMEMAAMLAHEPFNDRPKSVCPIIGAFLRTYNDSIDDRRRQDLYAYASRVVGTRGSKAMRRQRTDLCREWANRHAEAVPGVARRLRFLPRRFYASRLALAMRQPEQHGVALSFLEDLLAVGEDVRTPHDAGPLTRKDPGVESATSP
jgi:hypothetical protein